ncbi:MAG: hypothetical protein H6713_39115 [Myxococcales bacterium]|nr:hypothetical protein [Myxococcales bacterium]
MRRLAFALLTTLEISPLLSAVAFGTSCTTANMISTAPASTSTPAVVTAERAPEPAAPPLSRADAPVAPVAASAPKDPLAPLLAGLRELKSDPPPPATTNDTHYLVSNERRLDLYRPDIDGLGGVYVGVGTDQNLVMAGWSRPALMILVDFDQQVVDLHAIHGELLRASPDVAAFLRLWSAEGAREALSLLARHADEDARPRLAALYRSSRVDVARRLEVLARRYRELDVRSYLDTPADYAALRELFVKRRVVAVRGDFTHDGVVRRIAALLREHDQRVRVLYLSNIEQYFTYKRAFKDNMLALPLDESSVVLRTLPGRPAGFQYLLQRGDRLHEWMRAPRVWSVYRLRGLKKGEHLEANQRWVLEAAPP